MTDTRIGPRALERDVVRTSSGRDSLVSARVSAQPKALASDLRERINGDVRFSDGDRALYATDASNYRQRPLGVVLPRTIEDVRATVELCRKHGAPITSRGAGTSLAGQTIGSGVIIDFSRYMNRILELDHIRRQARVEPGCILDVLRGAAEKHGLTFGPDPATHNHNTLGGMVGNNSCGVHSVTTGRTADNVEGLRVLTFRGLELDVGPTNDQELTAIMQEGGPRAEIYRQLDAFRSRYAALIRERFPKLPRRVSGYADLDKLLPEHGFDVAKALTGTEGTCVTILSCKLKLTPSAPARALVILGFDSIEKAADAVPRLLEHRPLAVEGFDAFLVDAMQRKGLHVDKLDILPGGNDWLIVEFGGATTQEAEERAQRLADAFASTPKVHARQIVDPREQKNVWLIREAGLPASAYVPERPEAWEGWEDTAVPRERLGAYLRDLRALMDRYGYQSPMYGHFGDGLVHCRMSFDLRHEEGVEHWRAFTREAADLVVRYGGSLSGEHGDGQARADLLERMYGRDIVQAFREFKAIWDPDGMMNPGKIVDPYPMTSNLRLGPDYDPKPVDTNFAFRNEGGFHLAVERCVGVGKCRRTEPEGEVMCPSYMATHEEKHSTRGRARLLFEMMRGETLADGWRNDAVEDALSLCLACKGCKSDCPVNVDMATYKAEFRSHYYKNRLRPRTAYSMGLIHVWARAAAFAPRLANAITTAPGLSTIAKHVGGIARERNMPRFAEETFVSWLKRERAGRTRGGRRLVLWPDTFNNHFRPQTAISAVRALEAAGFEVNVPTRPLCCGRPLYDWGMLDSARKLWRRTFDALRADIEAGTPVVALEPACAAAFKDELPNLFPDDAIAKRLSRHTSYFSDFIVENWKGALAESEPASALVHIHCNHHAVIGRQGERALMEKLGLTHRVVPAGCCGMAGSFGFASESYAHSMTLGERTLLPAVRAADEDMIVASGFSCREQIEQATGRDTLHAAEAMARRLRL